MSIHRILVHTQTRGLFGGASLEGSIIIERSDANNRAYASYLDDEHGRWGGSGKNSGSITARQLLSGQVECPPWASALVAAIERCTGGSSRDVRDDWGAADNTQDTSDSDSSSGNTRRKNRSGRGGSDSNRDRGYSFGEEGKGHLSNDSYARDPEWNSPSNTQDSKKSRLRGYSLGSFGRSMSGGKSGSGGGGRERSWTTSNASPAQTSRPSFRSDTSFGDYDLYDEEAARADYEDFSNDPAAVKARARRRAREQDDVPDSPGGSIASRGSTSGRFKEFMTRPMLPSRKSTSAAAEFKRDRDMDLSASTNSNSRNRSASKSSLGFGAFGRSSSKKQLEYGGRYQEEDEDNADVSGSRNSAGWRDTSREESARNTSAFGTQFRSGTPDEFDEEDEDTSRRSRSGTMRAGTSSPFADSFDPDGGRNRNAQREGMFDRIDAREYENDEGDDWGMSSYGDKGGSPSYSPATLEKRKDKKRSILSKGANVIKSVRPGAKRASTAPAFGRSSLYNNGADDDDGNNDYFGKSRGKGRRNEDQDPITPTGFGSQYDDHLAVARGEAKDPFSAEEMAIRRSRSRSSSGSEDGGRRSPASPVRQSTRDRRAGNGYGNDGSGAFFSSRDQRDLLDTLDEDDDDDARDHRLSSSLSSHEPVQPRHRLDAAGRDDDDARSLRSLDSDQDFTFGERAIRIIKPGDTDGSASKTAGRRMPPLPAASSDREYVVAIYDFDGGEVRMSASAKHTKLIMFVSLPPCMQAADLSFKKGDVLEVVGKDDPDWWTGRNSAGQTGIIPVNRTKPHQV